VPSGVVVVVAVVAVGLVVAVAVAVIATVVVAAHQDSEWTCVGAYDLAGTGHFWIMFDAPHQERCYSAFRYVVAAWVTAVASVVLSGHDFATVPAR